MSDIVSPLADILVQYAADQAAWVGFDNGNPEFDGTGILKVLGANFAAGGLSVNLAPASWAATFESNAGQKTIVGLGALATVVEDDLLGYYVNLAPADAEFIDDQLNDAVSGNTITQLLFSGSFEGIKLDGSQAGTDANGDRGGNLIIGGSGNGDTITSSPGQDFIFLGTGSTTVYASWGGDIIVGGGGRNHILVDGSVFTDANQAGSTSPSYYFHGGSGDQVDFGEAPVDKFTLKLSPAAVQPNAPIADGQTWTEYQETQNGKTYTLWVDPVDDYDVDMPISATTNTSVATDDAGVAGDPDIQIDTEQRLFHFGDVHRQLGGGGRHPGGHDRRRDAGRGLRQQTLHAELRFPNPAYAQHHLDR